MAATKRYVFVVHGESGSNVDDTATWAVIAYEDVQAAHAHASKAEQWAKAEAERLRKQRERHEAKYEPKRGAYYEQIAPAEAHFCDRCFPKPRRSPFDPTEDFRESFRNDIRYFVTKVPLADAAGGPL